MPFPEYPQVSLPFRFEGGELAVVEQDSAEDYEAQVITVVVCPLGFRTELPEFGTPQPEFGRIPLDTTPIRAAVDEWVPNANVEVTEQLDPVDQAVSRLTLALHPED